MEPPSDVLGHTPDDDENTSKRNSQRTETSVSEPNLTSKEECEGSKINNIWTQLQQQVFEQIKRKRPIAGTTNWNNAIPLESQTTSTMTLQETSKVSRIDGVQLAKSAVMSPSENKQSEMVLEEVAETEAPNRKRKASHESNVEALLTSFETRKKTTVLDTTKKDWREYKALNKSDADELDAHQKSTEAYLQKQQFLHKAALNEHDAEIGRKRKQRTKKQSTTD